MPKCFISHANRDQSFVEDELLGLVKALNLEPWYAHESIEAAEQWEESILKGLEKSRWFILVMSSASAVSDYVKDEIAWAMKNLKGCIIPVMIQDCEISEFHPELPKIQHIDYQTDPNKAREELIKKLLDDQCHPNRRAGTIVGNWTGNVHENKGPNFPDDLDYTVEASIEVKGTEISGQFIIDFPIENVTERIDFDVIGGFLYEKFLQLNYLAKKSDAIQFGSIIASLSDTGHSMKGRFVGYSAFQEDIVTGSVTMTKFE